MATKQELEQLYEQISQQYTPESRILAVLLRQEIGRRKRAGRPAGRISRQEQNRLSQQRFRLRRKRLEP